MNQKIVRSIWRTLCVSAVAMAAIGAQKARSADTVEVKSDIPKVLSESSLTASPRLDQPIDIIIVLPLRDEAGAQQYAQHVSTPGDALYGQFLTPDEFGDRFGPAQSDYLTLRRWAEKSGLSVNEESRSRTSLSLKGTVAQFQSLFGVQFNNYFGQDGRTFYSANSAPKVPAELASKIEGVVGLSNYTRFAPLVVKAPRAPLSQPGNGDTAGGTGPGGAYGPADLRAAYLIPKHLVPSRTTTVAVFEQGGFDPNDVLQYESKFHLPNIGLKMRGVNGYKGAINDPLIELEAVLDIDMVIGINPRVRQVEVYEDGDDPFGVALLDALVAIANDNNAQVVSISYGADEATQGDTQLAAEAPLFQQLATQGITVLASAGDFGAYGREANGLNVEDPAAQPYVTAVGGTTLYTGPQEIYYDEEVWDLLPYGQGATGGGASNYWQIPSYQLEQGSNGPVSVAAFNGGSSTMRNIPDVAAVGNPVTGVAIYTALNGGWIQIGGTSVSAPIWAGYLSIIDSGLPLVGKKHLGFFNPLLYQIYQITSDFHDIQVGNNGESNFYLGIPGYNAGLGYDDCTGFGSMIGENFGFDLLTTYLNNVSGNLPATPTGLHGTPSTTTASISWTAAAGAASYIVQTIDLSSPTQPPTINYLTKTTSVKISGLIAGSTYGITVYAVNGTGPSNPNSFYMTTKSQ
jgi:subtilase family serine protease